MHPAHLSDARHEPVIVFLGEVPSGVETAMRTDFRAAQTFVTEHFEAEPADYTVYVAADWPSAEDAYMAVIEGGRLQGSCAHLYSVDVAFVTLPCPDLLRSHLGWFHFRNVQGRIAPRANPFTPGLDGVHPQGPDWLHMGTELYAQYAYLRSLDPEAAKVLWELHVTLASWSGVRLQGMEVILFGAWGPSRWASRGFFAAEWLAEQVGAPALLNYYRVVISSPDWREAFEDAFGMSVDAFYEVVEPHIDGIVAPMPHLTDDRDEPILVLLGDISPTEAAAARRDFDAAQEFFGERLGAPAADYTVYVAADDESALPAFRKSARDGPGSGLLLHRAPGGGTGDDPRLRQAAR